MGGANSYHQQQQHHLHHLHHLHHHYRSSSSSPPHYYTSSVYPPYHHSHSHNHFSYREARAYHHAHAQYVRAEAEESGAVAMSELLTSALIDLDVDAMGYEELLALGACACVCVRVCGFMCCVMGVCVLKLSIDAATHPSPTHVSVNQSHPRRDDRSRQGRGAHGVADRVHPLHALPPGEPQGSHTHTHTHTHTPDVHTQLRVVRTGRGACVIERDASRDEEEALICVICLEVRWSFDWWFHVY